MIRGFTEEQILEEARRCAEDGQEWPVRIWLISAGQPALKLWVHEDGTIAHEQPTTKGDQS